MVLVVESRLRDMVALVPERVYEPATICNRRCKLLFRDSETQRVLHVTFTLPHYLLTHLRLYR